MKWAKGSKMSNFDSYKSPKGEASADTNSIIAVSPCLTKIFSFQFRLYFMIQVGVFPMFCARKTASSSAQCWSREKKFLSTRRKRRRPRRIRKIHFYFPVTFSHSDSNFFSLLSAVCHSNGKSLFHAVRLIYAHSRQSPTHSASFVLCDTLLSHDTVEINVIYI